MAYKNLFISFCFLFLLFILPFSCSKNHNQDLLDKEEEERVRVYTNKAVSYLNSNLDSAIYFATVAVKVANEKKTSKPSLIAYYTLSNTLIQKGEIDKGLEAVKKALSFTDFEDNYMFLSACYNLLGVIYTRIFDYENALVYHQKSLDLSIQYQDTLGIAIAYNNIGKFHADQKQNKIGKVYYKKSLIHYQALKDTSFIGVLYNNLSSVSKNTEEKKKYLDRALYFAEISNNYILKGNILANIGSIYSKKKDYSIALMLFDSAFNLFSSINYNYGLPTIANTISEIYLLKNMPESSLKWANLSVDYSKKNELIEDLADSYKLLTKLSKEKNDYKQALVYKGLYYKYKDSLLSIKRTDAITKLEVRHGLLQKNKELQVLEKDLQISEMYSFQLLLAGGLLVFIFLLLFFWYRRVNKKNKEITKLELRIKETERAKLEEINKMKSVFLANISHELRTPLTLLLSPLSSMLDKSLKGNMDDYLKMMSRNGERLESLIDQLLNISRLEKDKWPENKKEVELWSQLSLLADSFHSHAVNRNIEFSGSVPQQATQAYIDLEKLEQIILNLLSNAFKYTEDKGKVSFVADMQQERLRFHIKDSGKGIPAEDLPHLFERFFRVEGQSEGPQSGTGIGLALVKELVDWFGGEIIVKSEPGVGTEFECFIPLELVSLPLAETVSQDTAVVETVTSSAEKPVILVVEDHPDVRKLLSEQLTGEFIIEQASDGLEGLQKATELVPDLVITDVMMPKMDGREFCSKLKKQAGTSHIPVIMLTALSQEADKLKGLEVAADHYLTKPFNLKEIQLIVKNLLEARIQMGNHLKEKGVLAISKTTMPAMEKAFLDQLISLIESKLEQENYTVDQLSKEIGLSRSQLYRKVVALTNQTPSQFMRRLRLQHSKLMLEERSATISEIAYNCGFSSLSYFSRCFQEEYGESPSSFMK
jgi:signal transduction histidine kinase/DNA-binding response OmpR family regulator